MFKEKQTYTNVLVWQTLVVHNTVELGLIIALKTALDLFNIKVATHAGVFQTVLLNHDSWVVHDLIQPAFTLVLSHAHALTVGKETIWTEAALDARLITCLVLHTIRDILAGWSAQATTGQVIFASLTLNGTSLVCSPSDRYASINTQLTKSG